MTSLPPLDDDLAGLLRNEALTDARAPIGMRERAFENVMARVALAETVASTGAFLSVVEQGMAAVGLEINANHLRGVREGLVTATATPIHKGRTTHVWHIEIKDENGKMVCISRCTLAIVPGAK